MVDGVAVAGQDEGRKLSYIDGINPTIYYKENSQSHKLNHMTGYTVTFNTPTL